MAFNHPIFSIEEFISEIKNGNGKPIVADQSRLAKPYYHDTGLPIELHENGMKQLDWPQLVG